MKLAVKCVIALLLFGTVLAHGQISSFEHVVVIVQENRTPDNLFQGLCAPPFGTGNSCSTTPTGSQYNIQTGNWLDKLSGTGVTQPQPISLGTTYDLSHAHSALSRSVTPTQWEHAKWTGPATSPV